MSDQELAAVKAAHQAMKNGTGTEAGFRQALEKLNGPAVAGETEYYLLLAGGAFIRLEDRITLFSSEGRGRMFAAFCRGGDCLARVTKTKLLKQLRPDEVFVLDPGDSLFTSPGKAIILSQLPA